MKIITADDEKLIRMSLISMLEESLFPIDIIEQAANGTEMLEKIKNLQPDIAFVDIQMPGLNGLDAIKIGQALSPCTQWIILTGYSEFSYARKALELGASGYLLKPVSLEELHRTLKKAINNNLEYLTRLNKKFENEMISFFHGINTINELSTNFSKAKFLTSIIYIDSHLEDREKSMRLTKFLNNLQRIFLEIQSHDTRISLFALSNNELALITSWGLSSLMDGEKKFENVFK